MVCLHRCLFSSNLLGLRNIGRSSLGLGLPPGMKKKLRHDSLLNSKMHYLNVQLLGLSGKCHPALQGLSNTQDVRKFRSHVKFLTSDLCQNPSDPPTCYLYNNAVLSSEHLLLTCKQTRGIYESMLPKLLNVFAQVCPSSRLLQYIPPPSILLQFILDCSSFNLPNDIRISLQNPDISKIFQISRLS